MKGFGVRERPEMGTKGWQRSRREEMGMKAKGWEWGGSSSAGNVLPDSVHAILGLASPSGCAHLPWWLLSHRKPELWHFPPALCSIPILARLSRGNLLSPFSRGCRDCLGKRRMWKRSTTDPFPGKRPPPSPGKAAVNWGSSKLIRDWVSSWGQRGFQGDMKFCRNTRGWAGWGCSRAAPLVSMQLNREMGFLVGH